MARTSDWVQEQSTQDQTSTLETVAHRAQPVTPPPRSVSGKNQDGDVESHPFALSTGQSRSKHAYSISALLRMRHMQVAVPVMLRVKPEAIAGKYTDLLLISTPQAETDRSLCREHLSVHGSS